ncbi:MAG: M13-type metalloendopeptidase [Elusimicrobiota bacterium]
MKPSEILRRCLVFILIAANSCPSAFALTVSVNASPAFARVSPAKVAPVLSASASPGLARILSLNAPSASIVSPVHLNRTVPAASAAHLAKQAAAPIAALTRAAATLTEGGDLSDGQARTTLGELYGEGSRVGGAVVPVQEGGSDLLQSNRLSGAGKKSGLGIDTSAMDRSVRPQDDFFRFVGGTWLKNFKMPADKSSFGAFDELIEKSERALKGIIDRVSAGMHVVGSAGQKIADLYKSFVNTAVIEAKGLQPIASSLAEIEAVETKADLGLLFARAARDGVNAAFGLLVDQDSKNTAAYIASMRQGGLGLPDRDYYFNTDESSSRIRAKYAEYLETLFRLAGEENAAQKAAAVFSLEEELARSQWTQVENRDADKTYNKVRVDRLGEMAPGFDWTSYLREAGVPRTQDEVIVEQPSYFKGFAEVFQKTILENWKLYMKARILDASASYLTEAFVEAAFSFKGRVLRGQPEMRPRWKRGVDLLERAVGELIGRIYVKENFPASSKARMERMIENLRTAYADRIKGLEWMGPQTKKKALDKLAKFATKIGHPDRWREYSSLEVQADDLVGNVRRSNRHEYDRMLAKLGRPVDRGEWAMTPQTVNAYYNATMNEIVFPAAILQGVFFNPEADDAVNYGAIGAVIGHEMGHGFDDEGSKFDGEGMLKSWWTPEDRSEFESRTRKLVRQFNAYSPLPGLHINGELTLGENIGDLAGMTVAYEAYRRSLNGAVAPVIDGFTGDQRFFMGWAQVWLIAARKEALEQQVKNDPHSPGEYRVNGVMPNLPAFYEAFGVKEGDKMYLPEKDRVKIW